MARGAGVLCWIGGPFDDLFVCSYATAVAVFFLEWCFGVRSLNQCWLP